MAMEAQRSLLLKSVHDWNQWRQQNPSLSIDLTRVDLRRAKLSQADLSQAKLSQVDLSDSTLRRANASNTDLRRAKLIQTNAYKVDLSFSDLRRATLQRINLRQANLQQARLCGTNLYGAELRGTNLMGAQLVGANLVGADLTGANLSGANLTGVNLKGANLKEANLTKAILMNADLTSIVWSDIKLSGAKFRNNVGLTPANQAAIIALGGKFIPKTLVRREKTCHLLIIRDMQGQRVFHLEAGVYRLGRDVTVDIQLSDQAVSRCHAILLRVNDDNSDNYFYRLVDGDGKGNLSQNGSRINRRRCSFHNLNSGDQITLGRTTLDYLVQEFTNKQLTEYMALMSRPGIPTIPDSAARNTIYTL